MDHGLIFYWIAWLCWVWVTWMMNKDRQRLKWAVILLIAVILSNRQFDVFDLTVQATLFVWLISGFYELTKLPLFYQIYLCLLSLISAMGYISLFLFAIYDPVWVIVPFHWICSGYLFLFSLVFVKSFLHRLLWLLLSISVGEIGVGIILNNLGLQQQIGTDGYLDRLAMAFCGIVIFHYFQRFVQMMEDFVEKIKAERRNVI